MTEYKRNEIAISSYAPTAIALSDSHRQTLKKIFYRNKAFIITTITVTFVRVSCTSCQISGIQTHQQLAPRDDLKEYSS
jgi:hypothetical protein